MTPTIGRRVYFFCNHECLTVHGLYAIDKSQPFDAGVVYVESATLVNVVVTDHAGQQVFFASVPLITREEALNSKCPYWCEWMPYQKQQAEKQEKSVTTELSVIDQLAKAAGYIDFGSMRQSADSWRKIVEVLDEVDTSWTDEGRSLADCAVTYLRRHL